MIGSSPLTLWYWVLAWPILGLAAYFELRRYPSTRSWEWILAVVFMPAYLLLCAFLVAKEIWDNRYG